MQLCSRVNTFIGKHPLVGPVLWLLSIQYFVVQLIVATGWSAPGYSWANHLISDLGNTECGQYVDRFVCSPLHLTMNISFVIYGITIALGALLIYQQTKRTKASLIGFGSLVLSGFGTILVGLFPENVYPPGHGVGAVLSLLIGNIGIVALAWALTQMPRALRIYTAISGTISLLSFALFALGINLGLGDGGIERAISYPFTIYLIVFGLFYLARHKTKN